MMLVVVEGLVMLMLLPIALLVTRSHQRALFSTHGFSAGSHTPQSHIPLSVFCWSLLSDYSVCMYLWTEWVCVCVCVCVRERERECVCVNTLGRLWPCEVDLVSEDQREEVSQNTHSHKHTHTHTPHPLLPSYSQQ